MRKLSKERKLAEALVRGEDEALAAFGDFFAAPLERGRREAVEAWPELDGIAAGNYRRRAALAVARRSLRTAMAGRPRGAAGEPLEETPEPGLRSVLEKTHLADLFLVCAMESGHEDAWRAFHRSHRQDIEDTARAFVRDPALRAEILDDLDGDLFAAGRSGRGLLATYEGRGPLGGWLRTVLCRRATALWRKRSRAPRSLSSPGFVAGEEPAHPAAAAEIQLPSDSLERIRSALQDTFAALPPRDRTLLLLRYTRGVTQKKLAPMVGWGEVKLSRHLGRLRGNLLDAVRLRSGLERGEFEESLARIRSSPKSLGGACFFRSVESDVKFLLPGILGEVED